MTGTRAGSDPPSTLGGPGWLPRSAAHDEEVRAGAVWAACGARSETAQLRGVLLAVPPAGIGAVDAPGRLLMDDRVDLEVIRSQARGLAAAYRREGVEVRLVRVPDDAPPNIVFMRDLFFMAPSGAVLARTASAQRAGEERHAALALARSGVPILRTITGTATFEGADALWLDESSVVVATGFRTDRAGAEQLRGALAEFGVAVTEVPLGPGVQHLLGSFVPVAPRVAVTHAAAVRPELRSLLEERGWRLLEFEPDDEVVGARGLNLVTLAPGRVLMPAGAPGVRRRLEAAGVRVLEADVSEYVKAAGGIGCVTGILRRAHG